LFYVLLFDVGCSIKQRFSLNEDNVTLFDVGCFIKQRFSPNQDNVPLFDVGCSIKPRFSPNQVNVLLFDVGCSIQQSFFPIRPMHFYSILAVLYNKASPQSGQCTYIRDWGEALLYRTAKIE
jgi:hypothetical protein